MSRNFLLNEELNKEPQNPQNHRVEVGQAHISLFVTTVRLEICFSPPPRSTKNSHDGAE